MFSSEKENMFSSEIVFFHIFINIFPKLVFFYYLLPLVLDAVCQFSGKSLFTILPLYYREK